MPICAFTGETVFTDTWAQRPASPTACTVTTRKYFRKVKEK